MTKASLGNANRTKAVIEDVGGPVPTASFTQTLDDLPATMTAVNADTGDQTTTWLYGTTLDDSGVARNDLVNSVIYPDGTLGWAELTANQWSNMTPHLWGTLPAGAAAGNDATSTTYNRLGEPATFTDQRGTTRTFTRDKLGRLTDDGVTTVGADTDDAVLRISLAYEIRGMVNLITGANYGAASSFTRPDVPPASSDTVLVGLTGFDDAGRPFQSTDPMGVLNQTNFDNANRTRQTIEDVGGENRTTNFTHTLDDLPATMTAVNAVTGNQTTTWLCGTTLADSGVARNDLVRSVIYPDGTLGWSTLSASDWSQMTANLWGTLPAGAATGNDATSTTYNRQGEPATFTDQRGTEHTFLSDLLGRPTHDCITTVGSNTDSAVLRISREYEIRGMVATITSADNATPGAGTILNQVAFTHNDFGQLEKDQQEHNGAVTTSTPSVQYAHDDGSSDSNEIRLNEMTYPNLRTIGLDYGTAGGMSDYLNRVEAINDTSSGTVTLAAYDHLGLGFVVRITSPEPGIRLDLWGGVSGVFAGIDLFGNVIDQRWQNNISTTPTDIDRFKYGRDRNSNPIWKANVVGTAAVTAGLDEFYLFDPLKRLTNMQRGVLTGGPPPTGIAATPSVEQDWTLDATGNWGQFVTEANGNVTMTQTRTANPANEITAIGSVAPPPPPTGTPTPPAWVTPAYDPAGNMITMPKVSDPTQSLGGIYDAWQRPASISDESGPVADYKYDGRGFRILKEIYSGGTVSETRHCFFTAAWQVIEERLGTSTSMDKQYVWGVGFIDGLICRDDATPQRLYACQDANFNLTSIVDASSGDVAERYLFDPYGLRTIMNAAWTVLSASAYNWLIGHQGLMHDPESGLIYNRMRVTDPLLGRAASRDPIGLAAGSNLYEYVRSRPVMALDPYGLKITIDSLPGASDAGEAWFHDAVLAAFQEVIGDCAVLSLKKGYNSKGEFDYSHIEYSKEKPGCKCDPCWQALKKAIQLDSGKEIFIHKWRQGQKQTGPDDAVGTTGLTTSTPRVYVHPDSQVFAFEQQPDGKSAVSTAMPFPVLLWHEAIGHGLTGWGHPGYNSSLSTQEGWQHYPGDPFSAGNRDDWESGDKAVQQENMARNCLGLNPRAFYYIDQLGSSPKRAGIVVPKLGT